MTGVSFSKGNALGVVVLVKLRWCDELRHRPGPFHPGDYRWRMCGMHKSLSEACPRRFLLSLKESQSYGEPAGLRQLILQVRKAPL